MQNEKFDYSCFYKSIWKILGSIFIITFITINYHSLMQLSVVKITMYFIAIPLAIATLALILIFLKWLIPFEKFSNVSWMKPVNNFFEKLDKKITQKITENAKQHQEFILGDVTDKVGCFSDWIAFRLRKMNLSEEKVKKVYTKTVNFSPISLLLSVAIAIVLIIKTLVMWIGDLVRPLNWFFKNLLKVVGVMYLINVIKQSAIYKDIVVFFDTFKENHPIATATIYILGLLGFLVIIEIFAIGGGVMMAKGFPIIGSVLYSGKVFTVPYMVDYYRKYRKYMLKAEYFAYREQGVIDRYEWMKNLSYYKTVIAFMEQIKNTVKITTKKLLELLSQLKDNLMYRLFGVTKVEVSNLTFKEQINFIMQKEETFLNRVVMLPAHMKVSIALFVALVFYIAQQAIWYIGIIKFVLSILTFVAVILAVKWGWRRFVFLKRIDKEKEREENR